MIVTETPRGWRCVTQPDHAALGHDILSLWRGDEFPRHPRRAEILLAAREHDNGWQGADAAPRLDPRGDRPLDFTRLAPTDRLAVWQRGIERYREERPYVAALILEHARYLHRNGNRREGSTLDDPWEAFLARLPELRDEVLAVAAVDLDALSLDYRFVHLADLVSLTACAGWRSPFERWGQRGALEGENTVVLSPFPLAGATAFSVPCRYLAPALHASDADLAVALARCRWERWTVRIAP